MTGIIKPTMDGPDENGWENEGSWEDLHNNSCFWKEYAPRISKFCMTYGQGLFVQQPR